MSSLRIMESVRELRVLLEKADIVSKRIKKENDEMVTMSIDEYHGLKYSIKKKDTEIARLKKENNFKWEKCQVNHEIYLRDMDNGNGVSHESLNTLYRFLVETTDFKGGKYKYTEHIAKGGAQFIGRVIKVTPYEEVV